MKAYKCRGASEKDWQEITSDIPEIAAEVYAELYGLDRDDIVSIWGIGKFKVDYIVYEPLYRMRQITGKSVG